MAYAYTSVITKTDSKPITASVADKGILVTDQSSVNMLDEGAIEKSFDFARALYEGQTDSTSKMMDFLKMQSIQETESDEKLWDFVGKMSTGEAKPSDFGATGKTSIAMLGVAAAIIFMIYRKVK